MGVYLGLLFAASVLGFFHVLAIGTFGLSLLEALFLGSVVIALYHGLWKGLPFRVPRRFETGMLTALLGAFGVSALATTFMDGGPETIQSLKTFSHFFYLWGSAMLLICLPITAEQWQRALRIYFVVAGVVLFYGIYQLPARAFDWPLAWIDISNASFQRGFGEQYEAGQLALRFKDFYRATSVFSEPSALAGYATATLVMLIVPYFRGGVSVVRSRWAFWTLVVLCALSIFLAFSLSGLALAGAAMVLVMILYPKESIRKLVIAAVGMLVLIGAADRVVEATTKVSVLELFVTRVSSVVSGKAAQAEVGSVRGESITQRFADYQVSWEAWSESPVFGVGPGNFGTSVAGRRHNQPFPSTTFGSTLAELGVIGFTVFGITIVGMFFVALWIERQWTARFRGSDSPLESMVPFLPFRWLLIILTAFTGNFLVSAYFWLEVTFLVSLQGLARGELGLDRWQEVYLVQEGWRSRLIRSREGMEHHGAHH